MIIILRAAVAQDDPHSAFFLPDTADRAEQGRCLYIVMTTALVRYIHAARIARGRCGTVSAETSKSAHLVTQCCGASHASPCGALRSTPVSPDRVFLEENLPTTATQSRRQSAEGPNADLAAIPLFAGFARSAHDTDQRCLGLTGGACRRVRGS